jgi:hypothetical protein
MVLVCRLLTIKIYRSVNIFGTLIVVTVLTHIDLSLLRLRHFNLADLVGNLRDVLLNVQLVLNIYLV